MDVDTLGQLVGAAQSGDLDAYGEIVRRFQGMACTYAYARLGDFQLAEDVAQEAFTQAYCGLSQLREPRAFPGWFRRIVATYVNRGQRRRRVPAEPLDSVAETAADAPGPRASAEHREQREALRRAVQSLPETQRTVTLLFYVDGYSQAEIAAFLERPVTTVTERLRAARKQLRERIEQGGRAVMQAHATDDRFAQQVKSKLLARCYGLPTDSGWRWTPAEPGHVARFRADGQEFVVRVYPTNTEPARLAHHAAFLDLLREHGLAGEEPVATADGDRVARLSSGETAMLLALDEGTFLPVPFGADDARAWGELTARVHACSAAWSPDRPIQATLMRSRPVETLDQALPLAGQSPSCRRTLDAHGQAIVSECQRLFNTSPVQPVHGELGPCSILKRPAGLGVVDVRASGVGPPAIDLATAFRWMPWRTAPDQASSLWRAWLAGYRTQRAPSDEELHALPTLASLECLGWLVVEVAEAIERDAPAEDIHWYLDDYSKTISALMARHRAVPRNG